MRTLVFDQYEFDPPEAEEGLEISVVTKRDQPFPDIVPFASVVLGPETSEHLPEPISYQDFDRAHGVRLYLERYANVTLPTPCNWPLYVISKDWDDVDVLLVGPESLIRYHWWTTA